MSIHFAKSKRAYFNICTKIEMGKTFGVDLCLGSCHNSIQYKYKKDFSGLKNIFNEVPKGEYS